MNAIEHLRPIKMSLNFKKEDLEEYMKVAGSIGFKPGELLQERFKVWLMENSIPVYDFKKVEEYLAKYFRDKHDKYTCFNWIPMREQDKSVVEMDGYGEASGGGFCLPSEGYRQYGADSRMNPGNGYLDNDRIYHKAIPMDVLKTVGKIIKAFPEMHFFIADVAKVRRPDPFLMVMAPGTDPFIIECWNEPKFK